MQCGGFLAKTQGDVQMLELLQDDSLLQEGSYACPLMDQCLESVAGGLVAG